MRINRYVAQATGLGRRSVDDAIVKGRLTVNDQPATIGYSVSASDKVRLDGKLLKLSESKTTVLLNKPTGYVCSRQGQGSLTIYDLLPPKYQSLKYVGRLDKETSGIIVLTDDGELANSLSHPSFNKKKVYQVRLDRQLSVIDKKKIEAGEIKLDNKPSVIKISPISGTLYLYKLEINEGRNRQIRRTFLKSGYQVLALERLAFGPYTLESLGDKTFAEIS